MSVHGRTNLTVGDIVSISLPTLGDEGFCTTVTTCGEDEGDCDSHDECQDGLVCGSNNCPASLGFDSKVDCCTTGKIRKLYELYHPPPPNMF